MESYTGRRLNRTPDFSYRSFYRGTDRGQCKSLSVCTLIREIRSQYAVGLAGIASAFLLSVTAVKTWSLDGTIVAFAGTLILQIAIQLFLIVRKVRKMNGNRK
ncbi:MAG: hypothetical protein ACLR6H_14455 [Roseburia sp.]